MARATDITSVQYKIEDMREKPVEPTIPSQLGDHLKELDKNAPVCFANLDNRIREAIQTARETAMKDGTKLDLTEAAKIAKEGDNEGLVGCARFVKIDENANRLSKEGCRTWVESDVEATVNALYKALPFKTNIRFDTSMSVPYFTVESGDISASISSKGELKYVRSGEYRNEAWTYTNTFLKPEDRPFAAVVAPTRNQLKALEQTALTVAASCGPGS